jgi:hypothetical protein
VKLRIPYHGVEVSPYTLQHRFNLSLQLMMRWYLADRLNERVIDAHLRDRNERYQFLAKAERHGISGVRFRDRLRLGWEPEVAATWPLGRRPGPYTSQSKKNTETRK